jgi:hypothetical protein
MELNDAHCRGQFAHDTLQRFGEGLREAGEDHGLQESVDCRLPESAKRLQQEKGLGLQGLILTFVGPATRKGALATGPDGDICWAQQLSQEHEDKPSRLRAVCARRAAKMW